MLYTRIITATSLKLATKWIWIDITLVSQVAGASGIHNVFEHHRVVVLKTHNPNYKENHNVNPVLSQKQLSHVWITLSAVQSDPREHKTISRDEEEHSAVKPE